MLFKKKPQRPKIIAIAGEQRAGKDTVLTFLQMELGETWKHASTSSLIINSFASWYTHVKGKTLTPQKIKDNKAEFRPALVKYGAYQEKFEPAFWVKLAMAPYVAAEGILLESVRRQSEFEHLRDLGAWFVIVRASKKTREKRDKLTEDINEALDLIKHHERHTVICNDGDLDSLRNEVRSFVQDYRKKNG